MESTENNTWTFTQEEMDKQIVQLLKDKLPTYLDLDRKMRAAAPKIPFLMATTIRNVTHDAASNSYAIDGDVSVEPFRNDGRAFYRQVLNRPHDWDREWLMWFEWTTTKTTASPVMPFSLHVAKVLGKQTDEPITSIALDVLSEEEHRDADAAPTFPVTVDTLDAARTSYGLYARSATQIGEALTGRSVIRSSVMTQLYEQQKAHHIDPEVKTDEEWTARFAPERYGYSKHGHKVGPTSLYVMFREDNPVAWFQYRANYTLQTLEILLAYANYTSPRVTATVHDVVRAMQQDHACKTVTVMKPPHGHWLEVGDTQNAYMQWFGEFPQFKSLSASVSHVLFMGSMS